MTDKLEDDLATYASRPTPKNYNEFAKAAELAIKSKTPPDQMVPDYAMQESLTEDYVWLLVQEFKERQPELHNKWLGKKTKPRPTIFADDYIVIDFETGGFRNTPGFRPVEYGILLYKGGKLTVRSGLVNPYLDDTVFQFPLTLEDKLNITDRDIKTQGIHPKACAQRLNKMLTHEDYAGLQVWGHNLLGFDVYLYDQEAERYDQQSLDPIRLRDSAALYKALKMSSLCRGDDLLGFMRQTLNARRKGLRYSVAHILANEELPINATIVDDEMTDWQPCPEIGITDEIYNQMKSEGLHRAGMDCVVTHAIIQWLKSYGEDMFLE